MQRLLWTEHSAWRHRWPARMPHCRSPKGAAEKTPTRSASSNAPINADMGIKAFLFNSSSSFLVPFPIRSNNLVDGAKARSPFSYIRERYTAQYASSRLYPECFLSFSVKVLGACPDNFCTTACTHLAQACRVKGIAQVLRECYGERVPHRAYATLVSRDFMPNF